MIGTAERLLSTVLQDFYQSHQATAAAVQVNNVHLVRGMLGRPGCGILQTNGQPTAENTREAGADGDLPAFRNWSNDAHVANLARIWIVDPAHIPHYATPTHAMQQLRYLEEGSIRMLWVICTNPAVSLPELARIRLIPAAQPTGSRRCGERSGVRPVPRGVRRPPDLRVRGCPRCSHTSCAMTSPSARAAAR